MKNFLVILTLLFGLSACNTQTPDLSSLSAAQWQEDVRFFMDHAPEVHIDLYHSISKNTFDSIGNDLIRRIPKLNSTQITAELIRWVASIGDGHTNLTPSTFHLYPIQPFWFKDGIYVINGRKEGKAWVDWQLEQINNVPVLEIVQKLEPYLQRDGQQQLKAQAPVALVTPELLQAVGVIDEIGKARFTFKQPQTGEHKTVELTPFPRADIFKQRHGGATEANASGLPLYRQSREKMYWFKWLPDTKTLYFQYNITHEDPHEKIAGFIKKMAKVVEENPLERFVVDVRWNGGGNLGTSKAFTEFIANHPKINQRGKLYVILGRHTFSAASYFVSTLEFRSKAIFVGESTGAKPNHYGDTRPLKLPNSGLTPELATIFWQNSFAWDKRTETQPDIWVEPLASDWLAKRDAALETILAEEPILESSSPIDAQKIQPLLGRYLIEADKMLEISIQNGLVQLRSPRFLESNLYWTANSEKLRTDIRSLTLTPVGEGQILLEGFGGRQPLVRLDTSFLLPEEWIQSGNTQAAITAYRALKQQKPFAFSVSEQELNRLGYELMKAQKLDAARAVFTLNTEFYPGSFNTWDSLAEYYMNTGNKVQAIAFYKRSIELNPKNENGKSMLKKLE